VTEVSDSYIASGFNQRLGFGGRPALVIVDFVNAYLMPSSPLYAGVEASLAAATVLLAEARAAESVPVVFTRVVFPPGVDHGPFFRKARALELFVGESEAGQIAPPLAPLPGEKVLDKQGASAFFATTLEQDLRERNVDTVLISGLSTSGCVRATAVDAVQLGFIPVIVREAVGDRAAGPHETSLFDLDAKYADVMSLTDVVTYLRALAPSPGSSSD